MTLPSAISVTWNDMLDALKELVEQATTQLILPTRVQEKDELQVPRAPEVFKMRLPDSKSAKKIAPYVLIQMLKSSDVHRPGEKRSDAYAIVRFILCVYDADEQEGSLNLLNMASRIRIALLKKGTAGAKNEFWLDETEELEFMPYQDDTAPYYAGEMIATFHLPPVQREVKEIW